MEASGTAAAAVEPMLGMSVNPLTMNLILVGSKYDLPGDGLAEHVVNHSP